MVYKEFLEFKLSEIGIGTYLGELDQETDKAYEETIRYGYELGINVVDSAINYRYMKSERAIGRMLKDIKRENLIISTKGGYVPYDIESGIDPKDYFYDIFVYPGIIDERKLTQNWHYLDRKFIDWCFNKSLQNLNTNYIDIYFLHNVEEQLLYKNKDEFYNTLKSCFELLEEKVSQGQLKYYGVATWSGFRISRASKQHLELKEILDIASSISKDHHFRFIQLPYNIGMSEAFTVKNQIVGNEYKTILEAAKELGVYVYTSASIYQGQVIGRIPKELKDYFGLEKDIHVALQFVRSAPGVGTMLVGTKNKEHLKENLEIENVPPMEFEKYINLFSMYKKNA
jgi:Predicted oxidoreductases (related to aryl-alcohol dehydrogenases)